MIDTKHPWSTSFKPLIWGFIFSLLLVLIASVYTSDHAISGYGYSLILIGIAGLQAICQLTLHMHIFVENKPRWNLITFLFLVLVIVVVVGGTLWIMYNLNYNTMPSDMSKY